MSSTAHDPAALKEMMEHGWRYFALHAEQRMSVFNFFLVLSSVVSAGMAATLQGDRHLATLGGALGLTLALVAFVFWHLDARTSSLIKNAEAALAALEEQFKLPVARLVQIDRAATPAWTYGRAFRVVYACMALAGIIGTTVSFCRVLRWIPW